MKQIIIILMATLWLSCSNDMEEVDLPAAINESAITVSQKNTSTVNVIEFSAGVGETARYEWNFGNGEKATGQSVTGSFPFSGVYKGTLTLVTEGGMTTKAFEVKIDQDNYELVNDPIYNFVSGGVAASKGKTWVLDSLNAGHLGVGPTEVMTADWWNAPALDKKGLDIYDDEMTFTLKGASLQYQNHGRTFVNGAAVPLMKLRGGTVFSGEGDAVMNYTPGTNWTWKIVKEGNRNFIVFPDGQGFFMFFTPGPYKYEILSMEDGKMYLRQQIDGLAWYFRLVEKQ